MTIHNTGSVIGAMRKFRKSHSRSLASLGVVAVDEQDRKQMQPRVGYEVRVLQEAVTLGARIWFLELNPWGGSANADEEDSERDPTIAELAAAAPKALRLEKKKMSCYSNSVFALQAGYLEMLVVMGKFQESCLRQTILHDDESGYKSAVERNIRVVSSGKLIQGVKGNPAEPSWASDRLVDFYRYVGTRSFETLRQS